MLNSKQLKCIELMVSGENTQKEISKALKVSEVTICNWKKNAEFMDEYNSALKDSIREVAAKAFKTQVKLLTAQSEMVRYMAAKDILDRAGFKPTEKVNVEGSLPVMIVGEDSLEE